MPANISNIVTWVLRLLVTAFFLFASYMKLSGNPGMVQEFGQLGMGGSFIYITGAMELIGALLVVNPGPTPWGCLLLLCVMAGAFIAQLGPLHGDVIHVVVAAAVLAVLFYLTRHPVMSRISGSA
jgi:putative oxidoreductase